MRNHTAKPLVVVTGSSSGIGEATARDLAQRGFHVLAGVRRDEDAAAIAGPGIEPIILDITEPAHIASLRHRIATDPEGRMLFAIVNNAGMGANAPVEVFDLDAWRKLFEVNYFGHIAVIQALLPDLIAAKGRIVNVSSVGGRIAMATYGPYGGTKFALEALSDSLRREVAPLGVAVVVVEPGAVRTRISASAISLARRVADGMTEAQQSRYGALIHAVTAQAAEADENGLDASRAADVIATALTTNRPRTRYGVGKTAGQVNLLRLLPDRLVDRMLARRLEHYMPRRPEVALKSR